MPAWLKGLAAALLAIIKEPLSKLATYLVGQKQGRLQQERDQLGQDLKTAIKAGDVRRDAERDANRDIMRRDDPNNRDND